MSSWARRSIARRFVPTFVSSRSVASVSATNRPAGRMASISAGVRSSIIALLSTCPFCRILSVGRWEDAPGHAEPVPRRSDRRTIGAMWLRRAFYGWLFPAAFLLPLWLLIGWAVFNAGGWAFLWVLFLAIPAVFI